MWSFAFLVFAVCSLASGFSHALDVPEVMSPELAIEQCVGAKKFTVKSKKDVQKEGSAAWKANGNEGPYPLPVTFEYVVENRRGKIKEKHTCKVQQTPSKTWKLIEGLLWNQP